MQIIKRYYQPVSLRSIASRREVQMRVHGDGPQGDSVCYLTPKEAVRLARGLLTQAEKLLRGPKRDQVVERWMQQLRQSRLRRKRQELRLKKRK